MPYRLLATDDGLEAGLRRIAAEQLDLALASLDDEGESLHARVHDARKRCKKLRALLRLVRPALPDYARENAHLRDAARRLSDFRDRTAMLETLDRLAEGPAARLAPDLLTPLREALEERRAEAAEAPELAAALAAFREDLAACRARSDGWTLEAGGAKVLKAGLKRPLCRARKAMARAEESRAPHEFHAWRKRVKYHWYHARLLREVWPRLMRPHRDAADDLAEILGRHHDLAEFGAVLQDPSLPMGPRAALAELVPAEMERLGCEALALGRRLLAETPKRLAKRWTAWWTLWRADAG